MCYLVLVGGLTHRFSAPASAPTTSATNDIAAPHRTHLVPFMTPPCSFCRQVRRQPPRLALPSALEGARLSAAPCAVLPAPGRCCRPRPRCLSSCGATSSGSPGLRRGGGPEAFRVVAGKSAVLVTKLRRRAEARQPGGRW